MGRVVALDVHGRLVYDGLLSSQEKATIDQILNALKNEILLQLKKIENAMKVKMQQHEVSTNNAISYLKLTKRSYRSYPGGNGKIF